MPLTHGLTPLSLIPGRSEASDRAEMSQQLLFGECYRVEEEKKDWLKIRTVHDDYPCWIDRKQHFPIEKTQFDTLAQKKERAFPLAFQAKNREGVSLNLVAGSILHEEELGPFPVEGEGTIATGRLEANAEAVLETARAYLGTPYLWGGRSPFGIDCSGFMQIVLLLHGVNIHRDASDQVKDGKAVDTLENGDSGDLAFFHNDRGRIVHVGFLTGDGHIIHASGRVRIDPIDEKGIWRDGSLSHSLNSIRRVL